MDLADLPEHAADGFVVHALLANGKQIESAVEHLDESLMAKVESYNRQLGLS
jgi:hypothetical protein